jgi:hypothetical protein
MMLLGFGLFGIHGKAQKISLKEKKISPFVQKKGSKDREPTEDRQTNLLLIIQKGSSILS